MTVKNKVLLSIVIFAGVVAIAIIAIFIAGSNNKGSELARKTIGEVDATLITMAHDDKSFTITAPSGKYTYEFKDIDEVVYSGSSWTADTVIDGVDDENVYSGTMKTKDGTLYDCNIYKAVTPYISIYVNGKTAIFNLATKDATFAAYNELRAMVFGS